MSDRPSEPPRFRQFTPGSEVRNIETREYGQLDFRIVDKVWLVNGGVFWAEWDEAQMEMISEPFYNLVKRIV